MTDFGSTPQPYKVVCVCGGYGFPLGTATAARIIMIGKAAQQAGMEFQLLHCGPSSVAINTEKSGIYEGIPFEYTTEVKRPLNPVARLLSYLRAAAGLAVRLLRMRSQRSSTLVYLYVMDGPLNVFVGGLCRVLDIPVAQELCEWLPGEPTCSWFTKWLYRKTIFKLATGTLVISKEIEARARRCAAEAGTDLLIYRVPAVVDALRLALAASSAPKSAAPDAPTFVYCGTWLKDIFFLVDAFQLVRAQGYSCRLSIIGSRAEQSAQAIREYVAGMGISPDEVVLTGSVDQITLDASYQNALALLMPLWNDDRSITRMPNKMGEYLGSGRPVITSDIGDQMEFLVDNVSAYVAEPGDMRDFANRMVEVLRDPARARQIGLTGQQACLFYLDYRQYIKGLANFFAGCIEYQNARRSLKMKNDWTGRLPMMIRNLLCGILAFGLIGTGCVRRARRRALAGGVVTALYFHKPEAAMFAGCIRWLKRYGYAFISLEQLIGILYRGEKPPNGAVWLSFDDGCRELLTNVLPVIRRDGIPVTLFVPSGIVSGDGRLPWMDGRRKAGCDRDVLTAAELKEISAYPEVTIASHTVNHAITTSLAEEEARFEFGESRRALETLSRSPVKSFAYPEGRYNGNERGYLSSCGYDLAATTENALITSETDPYLVPRFSVADEIFLPEAICNMVGVWRPVVEVLEKYLKPWKRNDALLPPDCPARGPETAGLRSGQNG